MKPHFLRYVWESLYEKWNDLVLEPFANIHGARYMMYWLNVDGAKWDAIKAELEAEERAAQLLESRTLDYVDTGTQQSESDHYMQQSGSGKGEYNGEYWRDGQQFSYLMKTKGKSEGVTLMCRYWGGDAGNRQFDIMIGNQVIATESLTGGKNEFINKEYPIPTSLLEGKSQVRVKFQAKSGNIAGGVYYLRLLMSADEATDVKSASINQSQKYEPIYTLSGIQVKHPTKGIYIKNDKKIVII